MIVDAHGAQAQRARTLLAQAASVRIGGSSSQPTEVLPWAADLDGSVLFVPDREGQHVLLGPAMAVATDVSPVPGPDRVRGVLTMRGRVSRMRHGLDRCRELLAVEGSDGAAVPVPGPYLRFAPTELSLSWRCEVAPGAPEPAVQVDVVAFRQAGTDPLAGHEAEWLTHLDGHHPDAMAALARWADPDAATDATVRPVALDRYGLVLRLRRHGSTRDLRLAFPRAAGCACAATDAVNDLFRRAMVVDADAEGCDG